jgi:hypothetical protein
VGRLERWRWSCPAAACAAALACVCAGCASPRCDPSWSEVTSSLDRAALAVWGRGDEVYVVGGGLGEPGRGALALHWDGAAWRELDTGRGETLWWVWGAPDGGDVWMVGEGGLVLRWDGRSFTRVESGTTATLYGVWGAAADAVWIVGGAPNGVADADDDLVLHGSGAGLARVELPERRGVALFKVWGASERDVWFVGERGTAWRRRDGGFVDHSGELATTTSLLTVHGCAADAVYAVGGQKVFAFDGESWREVEEAQAWAGANGVACGADGVLVVGLSGLKLRWDREAGAWIDEQLVPPAGVDFHGAWIAPGGGEWAVGGDFLTPPGSGRRAGAIAYRGCGAPAM